MCVLLNLDETVTGPDAEKSAMPVSPNVAAEWTRRQFFSRSSVALRHRGAGFAAARRRLGDSRRRSGRHSRFSRTLRRGPSA